MMQSRITYTGNSNVAKRDIYDQFAKAFNKVGAFAVMYDGRPVGRIVFKYPQDGAGRLTAYVHLLGTLMMKGHAAGFGYDKRTAACADAVEGWREALDTWPKEHAGLDVPAWFAPFFIALEQAGGNRFDQAITAADRRFNILQVI